MGNCIYCGKPAGFLKKSHKDCIQKHEHGKSVIVSLVRNNYNSEPIRAYGFLNDIERLNVMLSRSKNILIIIGNFEFFNKNIGEINVWDKITEFIKEQGKIIPVENSQLIERRETELTCQNTVQRFRLGVVFLPFFHVHAADPGC